MSREPMTEEDAIMMLLQETKRHGLAVEVLAAYVKYRIAGDEPNEAAWCAMYDWDL